jgi:hypothetical protein
MTCRAAFALLLLVCAIGAVACRTTREAAPEPDPYAKDWAVDPGVPGPDLPPAGRSLFDALADDPVPFPLSRLLDSIDSKAGAGLAPRRVLIPLGRSLQRSAGAPRFFTFPRAVVAFDAEPGTDHIFVKDRLFLGYHERAGVIEVISYNEEAGRFEFQVVKDYRPGARPRVFYAHRNICTTCHQNHAPLFPTQLWDETNSNYRVYRLLAVEGRDFYGFPVQQSADVPYQIDLAVHRANEFSVYQSLWSACDPVTRAAWLEAMLRCRLTGNCASASFAASLGAVWKARWPRGLRVPNPEIPNRNPLAILSREGPQDPAAAVVFLAEFQKKIDRQFEPAVRRPPLDLWSGDAGHVERVVAGLSGFFTSKEIGDLDRTLAGVNAEPAELHANCRAEPETPSRVFLRCESVGERGFTLSGRLHLSGAAVRGAITSLQTANAGLVHDLEITGNAATLASGGIRGTLVLHRAVAGLSARGPDGNRIAAIKLTGTAAVMECRRDFDLLSKAVGRLKEHPALTSDVFRPAPVLQELAEDLGTRLPGRRVMPAPARKPLSEQN